jgi:hypothetical protein
MLRHTVYTHSKKGCPKKHKRHHKRYDQFWENKHRGHHLHLQDQMIVSKYIH